MAYGNYGEQSYGGGGGNQYSTTSYGAQGGADGGGFMGGSQGGSQPTGKGTYGKETLRPVTILQILSADQPHPDSVQIDGVEVSQLCFVGKIINISKQATNMTYKLEDGTGMIEVKVWIDTAAPTHDDNGNPLPVVGRGMSMKEHLEEGQWAKVWGTLKSFNNRRHVGSNALRSIKDWNEINAHLLEATFVHLYFTRGPPEQFNGGAAGTGGAAGGVEPANGGDTVMGGQRFMPNLSMNARKVLQCLSNTPQGNEGLNMQVIANETGMSIPDVQKGGDELLTQSLIFTTVDDYTWALLEN